MFKDFLKKPYTLKRQVFQTGKGVLIWDHLVMLMFNASRKQNYLNKFYIAANYTLCIYIYIYIQVTPSMKSKVYDLGLFFV